RRCPLLGFRPPRETAWIRSLEARPPRLPAARRPADRVARPVARALELPDVRRARACRGRRESPRLDRLRTEVHRRRVAALGRLPLRGPDEGARRPGAAALRRF